MVSGTVSALGSYVIKFYENGSNVPTQTKTIIVQ
jgi:hypothetical protein